MADPLLPPWDEVVHQVRALQLPATAADVHGALCGWLCGGGADSPAWLAQVLVEPDLAPPQAHTPLDQLHRASLAQLGEVGLGLTLLLPPADAPLQARADALLEWCRSFLGGFALATGAHAPLGEDGQEALEDLTKLAAARPDVGEGEEDEQALAEIEEYVRVAALLLHGDCVLAARNRRRLN